MKNSVDSISSKYAKELRPPRLDSKIQLLKVLMACHLKGKFTSVSVLILRKGGREGGKKERGMKKKESRRVFIRYEF